MASEDAVCRVLILLPSLTQSRNGKEDAEEALMVGRRP